MTVREVTFTVNVQGFRTKKIVIATSLLDPKRYKTTDFAALYLRRWRAELYLRDIKTNLGMDTLTCKTPKMINKEKQMYLIAYNLIRLLMQDTALRLIALVLWEWSPPFVHGRLCLSSHTPTGAKPSIYIS